MKLTKTKLKEIIREEIQKLNEKKDKFDLGTPVVYKDGSKTYTGEVVMNPKHQRINVGGRWTMVGKGAIKGIQTYKGDSFIVPDDWKDVKKF